jgi:hypothetical protein
MRPDEAGSLTPRLRLRYLLCIHLIDVARPQTLAELTEVARRDGADLTAKVLSDLLRSEVRKGRIRRVRRGIYARGMLPRSTEWWIRRRLEYRQATSPIEMQTTATTSNGQGLHSSVHEVTAPVPVPEVWHTVPGPSRLR